MVRQRAFWADVWSIPRTRRSAYMSAGVPVAGAYSDTRGWRIAEAGQDVRYTLRLMRRQPAFTALALATLAIGIGASTAVFTICDRVLLRPLPYPDPDRVVMLDGVGFAFTANGMGVRKSIRELPVFTSVGLYAAGGVNLGAGGDAHRLRAAAVTSGFFTTLGVAPARGRTFNREEDQAASAVAVLSAASWQRLFAGADVLGRTIQLNSRGFEVIGVMPPGLTFPEIADVWVPVGAVPQITGGAFAPMQIARLAPGVSIPDAVAALTRLEAAANPAAAGDPPIVTSLHDELTLRLRPTLLFLAAVVGLLLAVTAANLAGLMLSRLRVRERELLVRAALGAGRGRLLRQVLTECRVIGLTGAIAGTLIAVWSTRLFRAVMPGFAPDVDLTSVDARFLSLALLVTAATIAMFCLGPAAGAARPRVASALRQVDAHGRRGTRFGQVLVVSQVAIALVLLAAGGAALSSMVALTRVDLGFHNDRATLFELTMPLERYKDSRAVGEFWTLFESRLRTVPGYLGAGASSFAPGSNQTGVGMSLRLAGTPVRDPKDRLSAAVLAATPDYFRVMGIALLEGRAFSDADKFGGPPVAIISRTAARQLRPDGGSVVGQLLEFSSMLPKRVEIIGVVDDVRLRTVKGPATSQLYQPLPQAVWANSLGVAVDSTAPDAAIMVAIKAALREVDSSLPMYNVTRVGRIRAQYLETERLTLGVSGAFAAIGLLLSAIGLYGVLSQAVAQRRREIGIRMALGANRARLRWEVVRSGLALTIAGIVIGGVIAAGAGRAFASVVPGLTGPTWPSLLALSALMAAIAIVASWAPARRASATDPIEVLKE